MCHVTRTLLLYKRKLKCYCYLKWPYSLCHYPLTFIKHHKKPLRKNIQETPLNRWYQKIKIFSKCLLTEDCADRNNYTSTLKLFFVFILTTCIYFKHLCYLPHTGIEVSALQLHRPSQSQFSSGLHFLSSLNFLPYSMVSETYKRTKILGDFRIQLSGFFSTLTSLARF